MDQIHHPTNLATVYFNFFLVVVIIISLLIYNSLLCGNDFNLWLTEYDINIVLNFSLVFSFCF